MSGFSSNQSPPNALAAAAASALFLPEDVAGEAQPESSNKCENESGGGGDAAKMPDSNNPSNGSTEIGPVMGIVYWPALSESTRASPKSYFWKTLSDESVPVPVSPGTGMTSPSANKQGSSSTANSNSTSNHDHNNNSSSNGGISQMASPIGSATETTHENSGKHANSAADSSSRDNTHPDGGQRSQSQGGNEHQQQRNRYRRVSCSPQTQHRRGDEPHHPGYGERRGDQYKGNRQWNSNRSFGGRYAQFQQQRFAPRPFIRGPPPTQRPPFIPPAPIPLPPLGNPTLYPRVPYLPGPHPDSFRITPNPPMFFPFPDPQLQAKILNQIDYYFSNENLIKDTYLRQQMGDQGWVPIETIAKFNRVAQLSDNIQLILDSVRMSSVVEVEGQRVRRRNDWTKWILPPSFQYRTESRSQTLQNSS